MGRVAVPLWLTNLSVQLPVVALVGHYPTNKLIGRRLIQKRLTALVLRDYGKLTSISAGYFNVVFLFLGCFAMAILGDSVGYYFGQKTGPKIFSRPDSLFFKKQNLEKTSLFFKKYGDKTITLARFIPIVRTFAPILAGVGRMDYKIFIFWNILGALFWSGSMIFGGYFLGNSIENIDKIILPIVLLIIIISLAPILWHLVCKKV